MPSLALSRPDREFFGALADVVFGNPFSARRIELIARLASGARSGDLTSDPGALARVVNARIAPWVKEGASAPRLSDADRQRLEPAFLYLCYHRAIAQLD